MNLLMPTLPIDRLPNYRGEQMAHEAATHKVTHTFEVKVERDDDEEKERRYQAYCRGLTGCRVCASSKTKALRRIREAIGVWLELADCQLTDADEGIQDMIDMAIAD